MIQRWLDKRNVALVMTALAFAGCGGDEGGGAGGGGGGGDAAVQNPVDPASAGNVAGSVTLLGTAPAMAPIDLSAEPTCAARHTSPPAQQAVVAGPDGGLANVFVYVREGLEGLRFPTPSQAVVLDQNGCIYVPHVFGVQTGQTITIRNSDGLLHNINADPTENRPFNVSQPVNMETTRTFSVPEVMVPVRCDVHGWMNAYIGVVDHPYYAVSEADGSVSLPGLPPGDYVVEAWHERYGTLTRNVTVTTGQTAEISFEFTGQTAGVHVPLGEPVDLMHPAGHTD